MNILPHAQRPFACDKCGTMHQVGTNHEGTVYMQKCKNWPCTPGQGQYTTMSFWGGPTKTVTAKFVDNNHQPVRLEVKCYTVGCLACWNGRRVEQCEACEDHFCDHDPHNHCPNEKEESA